MRGQSRRLEDGSWNGFFSTEVDLTKEKHLDELPWQDTTPKLGVEEEVT